MSVPTIIFLPLILWPVCWMIVQLARIDNDRRSRTERLFKYWDGPTWISETTEVSDAVRGDEGRRGVVP